MNDYRISGDEGILIDADTCTPLSSQMSVNAGGPLTPLFAVIHYTAGRSLGQTVSWLSNPRSRASAHLVIGRDGEVVQLVPFNRQAWHAGRSKWTVETSYGSHTYLGLNQHSIGIELENYGKLALPVPVSGGRQTWFGRPVPDDEIHIDMSGSWHRYTEKQIQACLEVCEILFNEYDLHDILGHSDIAPRKLDPGPAFPMDNFRAHLLGRKELCE